MSILGYHGYSEQISQICPYMFCPINSSFSGTPSPSHHSRAPTLLFWWRHCSRAPRTPTTPRSSIFSPARRWPSTSSFLRSAYCPFLVLLLYPCSSAIFLTESFFLFCSSFRSQKSRIWLTRSLSLPIDPISNALVH